MDDPMIQADPKKIQAARKNKELPSGESLTQEKLLELLDQVGIEIGLRTLQETEKSGWVRRSVFQAIAKTLKVPFDSLLADGQVPWWIPAPEWVEGRNSPSMLLQAEMAIVPFQFRNEELSGLEDWCMHPSPLRIRLITARGGMGKTRLALEFCRHMRDQKGWRAGFLNYEFFQPNIQQWDALLAEPDPLLLVLDYAESRIEQTAWLLMRISTVPSSRIRIVLLARHPGDWWTQLKSHRVWGYLSASQALDIHELRPVTLSPKDRKRSFQDASKAFSAKLRKPCPDTLPEDIESPLYERVLLLHIRALASIDGDKPKGENGILDYLLNRERRFWGEQLSARGLDATLLVAVEEAMASITANGGKKTAKDGLELLNLLPSLEGRPADVRIALNNLLSDCYPGDQWIEPVQPDLFGERLFQVGFKNSAALKGAVFAGVTKAARAKKDHV